MVEIGEQAPDFTLRNTKGEDVRLGDHRGRRALLVFYPQDQTTGWTNQLVAVRDAFDRFRALDTDVYGINPGDAASHQAFIDAFGFPFDLLVDDGLAVARAYDALKPEGNRINRTVVIVGKDGRVIFRAQGAPDPADLLLAISAANDSERS